MRRPAVTEDTHLYQHADHPYALANFDRRFTRKSDGEPGILECKSCTYHKADEWADDAIPLHYEFQLRFYLAVADVDIGAFSAVWGNNPDNDLAIPEIVVCNLTLKLRNLTERRLILVREFHCGQSVFCPYQYAAIGSSRCPIIS